MAFVELVFGSTFLVFMNVCTVFALLPEDKSLRILRAIVSHFDSIFTTSFPLSEDGQVTSQPRSMISVTSQPVVRNAL